MPIGRKGALAALALVGVAAASAASVQAVRSGPQTLNIVVKPRDLPSKKFAPASLRAAETTAVGNESPPDPRMVRALVQVDSNGKLSPRGLPRCKRSRLVFTTAVQARARCKAAIVGTGFANAKVNFPDQEPFFAPAPVTVFNAPPKNGKPVFMIHAYALRPAPTTFLVPGVVRRAGGKYRYKVLLKVPTIAGGSGTLTEFRMTLKRRFRYRGKRRSYVLARCPARRKLLLNVRFFYADGTSRNLTAPSHCR